jgi:hypothetical protein
VILPSLLTIGTAEGTVSFMVLLIARWKMQRAARLKFEDIFYLCVEVFLLVGATTAGIQAVYFGVTGEMYPESSQFIFRPQITIIGLALITGPPLVLYQRLKRRWRARQRRSSSRSRTVAPAPNSPS